MYADEEDDESYFDYEGEGFPSLATRNSGYGGLLALFRRFPLLSMVPRHGSNTRT